MKKRAFTLTEVLITLTVIGVVATLTLPALNSNVNDAQIGPKLAKAATMLEHANRSILNDMDVSRLSDTGIFSTDLYSAEVAKYISLTNDSSYDNSLFEHTRVMLSNTGIIYGLKTWGNYSCNYSSQAANMTPISDIYVDINGNKGANKLATDVFVFTVLDNGAVVPKGSSFLGSYASGENWTNKCPIGLTPNDPEYCAANIFENNLKVLYKK